MDNDFVSAIATAQPISASAAANFYKSDTDKSLKTEPGMIDDFRHLRIIPALGAIAAMFLLAGCQTDMPGPAARNLPPVPGRLMRPVPVPTLFKGEDARAALRLSQSALIVANSRLSASAGWYEGIRKSYSIGR